MGGNKLFKPAESNNIFIFLTGSILTGIAMGIGSTVGQILAKGFLRYTHNTTGALPDEMTKDL